MANPANSKFDLEAIGRDYCAGILSIREIGRQHGCSEGMIRKWAKVFRWKRDLSQEVRKRANENLVRETVRVPNASDDEIADAAAAEQTTVRKLQRKDIAALREMEQRLLAELGENPTKLWVGQYQGEVIKEEVDIAVTERSAALQALAAVQHKRIALERQAYGIDDGTGPEGKKDPIVAKIEMTVEEATRAYLDGLKRK